jgi:hypothetical protein
MRCSLIWLVWLLGLGGCTAHSLRCDGSLIPINSHTGPTATEAHPASKDAAPAQ